MKKLIYLMSLMLLSMPLIARDPNGPQGNDCQSTCQTPCQNACGQGPSYGQCQSGCNTKCNNCCAQKRWVEHACDSIA